MTAKTRAQIKTEITDHIYTNTAREVTGDEIANELTDLVDSALLPEDFDSELGDRIGVSVQAYDAELDTWATKTAPTGTVVGDADAQTLTNKLIDADDNTIAELETDNFKADVIDTDTTLAANSNTRIAPQAAVKAYIDNTAAGLSWKEPVRVATTANGTLATAFDDGSTVDDIVLATGDRILIKDQTTATENGIYVVEAAGAPTRATDADQDAELPSAVCLVTAGTANEGTQWVCNNTAVTIGVTDISFVQIALGGGAYTAGSGLTLTGNSFAVDLFNAFPAARTALDDIDTTKINSAFLREAGREGWFKWNSADLSTQVTNDPGQGVYVPPASDTTGASGCWVRSYGGPMSAKWFGAAGDGSTDDTTAVQRAINYASFLSGSSSYNLTSGIEIFFPYGEYITNTGWTITADGVRLQGESHRGSILSTNTSGVTLLTIGDATYATQTYFIGLCNLGFLAKSGVYNATNTTAILCHDVINASFHHLVVSNFYKGIEAFRLNNSHLDDLFFTQNQRTANAALFALGMKGRTTDGSGSGGNKYDNIEIHGSATLSPAWQDGILIMSADGGYFSGGHVYECNYDLRIAPDGTDIGNVIADLKWDNWHFDTAYIANVKIEGTTVAAGGAVGSTGVYRGITFGDSCSFIGGAQASQCILVSVAAANAGVQDLTFGGHYRQATTTAIFIQGASSSKVDCENVTINGSFDQNNYGGATATSCVNVQGQNIRISGMFGADQVAATRCVNLTATGGLYGSITDCDFSDSNCTGEPIAYSAVTSAKVLLDGNSYPTQTQVDYQHRTIRVTDATPTAVWSYALPANKVLYVDGYVICGSTTGAQAASYRCRGMWRRSGAAAATTVWTATNTVDGETTASMAAVLALSTNTVTLTFTGVAGATIDVAFVPWVIWGN